jgi:hypothetical protein
MYKLRKIKYSQFSSFLYFQFSIVIILNRVYFLGRFELVGKFINRTTNLDKVTFVLPQIYGLELDLKIAF